MLRADDARRLDDGRHRRRVADVDRVVRQQRGAHGEHEVHDAEIALGVRLEQRQQRPRAAGEAGAAAAAWRSRGRTGSSRHRSRSPSTAPSLERRDRRRACPCARRLRARTASSTSRSIRRWCPPRSAPISSAPRPLLRALPMRRVRAHMYVAGRPSGRPSKRDSQQRLPDALAHARAAMAAEPGLERDVVELPDRRAQPGTAPRTSRAARAAPASAPGSARSRRGR